MTDRSAVASVDVETDPATAFRVFTEEINLWWVRGPINFFDARRAVAMRIEPGLGGRVLEVYEDDALELGRITTWEPGRRLCYRSSVDDTAVDVRFDPIDGGTRVHVRQYLRTEDGTAFYFWRNVIGWFRSWCAEGHKNAITEEST
jgi:hypothetical protein